MLSNWYLQGQFKVELPIDETRRSGRVYNAYIGRDASVAPNT
jgi:hypothetical protein